MPLQASIETATHCCVPIPACALMIINIRFHSVCPSSLKCSQTRRSSLTLRMEYLWLFSLVRMSQFDSPMFPLHIHLQFIQLRYEPKFCLLKNLCVGLGRVPASFPTNLSLRLVDLLKDMGGVADLKRSYTFKAIFQNRSMSSENACGVWSRVTKSEDKWDPIWVSVHTWAHKELASIQILYSGSMFSYQWPRIPPLCKFGFHQISNNKN